MSMFGFPILDGQKPNKNHALTLAHMASWEIPYKWRCYWKIIEQKKPGFPLTRLMEGAILGCNICNHQQWR
jgi:hypothetical protein